MIESKFQKILIDRLKSENPGCIVLKNDPLYIQGIPDLLVLHEDTWVAIEVKKDASASFRPNQKHYLEKMDDMSAAFVAYPENLEEVLDEVQRTFKTAR